MIPTFLLSKYTKVKKLQILKINVISYVRSYPHPETLLLSKSKTWIKVLWMNSSFSKLQFNWKKTVSLTWRSSHRKTTIWESLKKNYLNYLTICCHKCQCLIEQAQKATSRLEKSEREKAQAHLFTQQN